MMASKINISTLNADLLCGMLFPYAMVRQREILENDVWFAHYSDANAISGILENEEFWLTSAENLQDSNEVSYGKEILFNLLRESKNKNRFDPLLEEIGVNIRLDDVIKSIDDNFEINKQNIFIGCITEHKDTEKRDGSSYMWKHYASRSGVVVNLKNDILMKISMDPNVYLLFAPVLYVDEHKPQALQNEIERFITGIGKFKVSHPLNTDVESQLLLSYLGTVLTSAIFCIKKASFWQEKEWRIVLYDNKNIFSMTDKCDYLEKGKNSNDNHIYKLKLRELFCDELTEGSTLPFLVNNYILNANAANEKIDERLYLLYRNKGINLSNEMIIKLK